MASQRRNKSSTKITNVEDKMPVNPMVRNGSGFFVILMVIGFGMSIGSTVTDGNVCLAVLGFLSFFVGTGCLFG